jgi:uncharacterized membrane protein HdeD (DUF308 family)
VTEPREPVTEVVEEVILVADSSRLWLPMAVRGVVSLGFGVLALLWPGITVLALALLFGAWALLDGVSFLVAVVRAGRARASWREWLPLLVAGVFGLAAAVVTVVWPVITVLALTSLAAALLIGVGVVEIMFAVRLRKAIRGEQFMIFVGVLSVLAGLAIAVWPEPGILALTLVLGVYAIVGGILLVVAAMRLRALAKRGRTQLGRGSAVGRVRPVRRPT